MHVRRGEMSRHHQRPLTGGAALLAALLGLAALAAAPETPSGDITPFARVGFSRSPAFSPDGRRVAFVSDASGSPQVWVVPTEGGWPARLTSLSDPVGTVRWSPVGDQLAFTVAPGGGSDEQLYLLRADGTELTRITPGRGESNWWGRWSRDGALFAFSSDRGNGGWMNAYLYRIRSRETRPITGNDGAARITDIGDDGTRAIAIRAERDGGSSLLLVDLRNGDETLLAAAQATATLTSGAFAQEGRAVYFVTDSGRELAGLALVHLDEERNAGPLEWARVREDAVLEEFAVSGDGETAAALWNSAGRSEVEFLDLESGESESGPRLPHQVASEICFSRDGRLLAMTLTGSTAARDVWLLERQTGGLRRLTQTPRAGVDLASLVSPEIVEFRSHDGLELSGWLYRSPFASRPGPLVVSFHDGPEDQERPGFRGDYQALVARGISVFAPNVRGSSGFGGSFAGLDNGSLRGNALRDIRAAADYVVRAGIADPERIGVMGAGYGGYMAMAGLTEYPESFAAGVVLSGFYDLETLPTKLKPWAIDIWKREFGDPDTQLDMLRALSPIHKLARVDAPILFLHGANDGLAPPSEVEKLVDALRSDDVPVELITLSGEGRVIRRTANRVRAISELVRWFDRLLE